MAIRCKKKPAKKKCCIRSSKLRKCTLKNMCPRKRCKKTACDPLELQKLKDKYSRDLQSHRELISRQQMALQNTDNYQALSTRYKKEAEERLLKMQKDAQKIQDLTQKLTESNQNTTTLNMRLMDSTQSAAGLGLEKMKLAEEKKILQEEKRKLAEEKERLLAEKKILNHALDGVTSKNKDTIIKLGKQIEECRNNLLMSVNELANLRSTGTASQSTLDNLRKDIEKTNTEYKDLIKDYRSQMATCQSQLKNCKDSKLQIEELKSQLQSEVIRYKNDNQLQKTLLTESMETNKSLLSKYDTLTEERDKMKQALGNLAQSSMARTERLKRELEESNKRNNDSSDCNKKLQECNSRLGVCDSEKAKLLADIQILKKEMAKGKWQGAAKGSVLQQEYQQLQQEYQAKVAEFQKYQAESVSEIAKLKKELENYGKQIQNRIKQQALSKGKRTEMSQEIENMKRDYQMSENQLNERIKNLNEENASLKGKYTECTSQKSDLEQQIRQCKANTLTLTTAIAELKGSALALKKDLTDQKEYIERSKNTLKEQNAEIGNLTNRIGKLQNVNEDKAKLINDLEQSNARFNELQKEFNKVTLKVAELESSLATSLGNFAEKSKEANTLIQQISTLSAELEQLKGADAMNSDRIKSLESEISRLNGSLNRLKSDLGDKNSKMEELINQIAGQTIGQLIASYQELASYYNKKNAELRSNVKRMTPEEKQLIDDQITNNNQIIKTIKDQLMILLEQQDKFKKEKAALERLNRFNEEQAKLNIAKAELEKFKLSNKLIESNIERNKAQREEALRKEQERIRAEQERQAQLRAEELAKIQQTIDDLKNVKPMPLYLAEILKNYKEPSGIINGKDIYQNLTLYNDRLLKTGLTDVYQIVKNLMIYDAETFRDDAKKAQKASLIDEFIMTIKSMNPISTYSDDLLQLKQKVSILFDKFVTLKDEIYPVRIIVNFGANPAANTPVNDISIPENNYKDEKVAGDPRMINIIVEEYPPYRGIPSRNYPTIGPFYGVTNTSANDYNVNADIVRVFNPKIDDKGNVKIPHLIYSAYGFSGSGKSYTLIAEKNKNNLLARVIKSIKSNVSSQEKNSISLKYTIYDNYGEINDGGCDVLTGLDDTQEGSNVKSEKNSAFVVNKRIKIDDYTQIENDIISFEKQRRQMVMNPNGRSEFHIRFTPNNDQSSRSHLFVDIDIMSGNTTKGRITIIDMAGSEDVNTIQNSYFLSVPTNYSGDAMVESLENISTTVQHLVDNISKVSSQLRSGDVTINSRIKSELGMLNFTTGDNAIKPFELINQKGSYIKKDAWTALMKNLESLGIKLNYSDFDNFIKEYNFSNYYSKIVYPIYQLKTKILETFDSDHFKLTNSCTNCADFSKLNEIFKRVGLTPLANTKLDLSGLVPKINNSLKSDTHKREAASNIPIFFKMLSDKLQPEIDNIYNVLVSSNNGELMKLIDLYNKDLDGDGKQRGKLASMALDPGDLAGSKTRIKFQKKATDKLINDWNKDYLYKLHCSIRYQGVYIVNTLNQMKNYVSCLQKHKELKSQFPGNILHNPLTFSGGTRDTIPNSQAKFILFNNIRLDFSTDGKGVKSGAEQQNENIKAAYINSIKFADSINPLTGKMAECNPNLSFGKRKSKKKEGKLISDYKYILSL
jgi:chromosome segregation ATPase